MTTDTITASPEVGTAKLPRDWVRRAILGAGLGDFVRLPRYLVSATIGVALIWGPVLTYLATAPLTYVSQTSLILPGSGASASMNLNGIGQASSYANSAFSSNSVSPTETYKRLLSADRILAAAADSLDISRLELGKPRVKLVNQTNLIHFEISGGSPEDAQARGDAILLAFHEELNALRFDEQSTRESSGQSAMDDYRKSVSATRDGIETLRTETGLQTIDQYEALLADHAVLDAQTRELAAEAQKARAGVMAMELSLGLDASAAAMTLKLFADSEYLALMDDVALLSAKVADATSQFGPKHPAVLSARDGRDKAVELAFIRAEIVTGLDTQTVRNLDLAPAGARADLLKQLVEANAERMAIDEHLSALQNQLVVDSGRLERLGRAASRLQDLERDFSVAEAVFASAIAKTQTNKSDLFASYPLVQVLENPSLPEQPSSPNRMMAYAAGVAATLMMLVGLFLAWIRLALISRLLAHPKRT